MFGKINSIFYRLFRYPWYRWYFAEFGKGSHLFRPLIIEGRNRIYIGKKVWILNHAWLAANPLTGDPDCRLIIGDGSYLGNNAHIYCTSRIEIGKKVLIADRVYISDNMHGYENPDLAVIDQPVKQMGKVHIGDGAWLGENVCIIGARVGKHAVVAANAVVTKDIPDYAVAVGIPARIIKRYDPDQKAWRKTNEAGDFI